MTYLNAVGVKQPRPAGDRQGLAWLTLAGLTVLLLGAAFVSLATGASGTSFFNLVAAAIGDPSADVEQLQRDQIVVMAIRLPRLILGVLVGAALAVSGAVMQGLFRNPLADPGLVGISSGAALGAVSIIVLGTTVLAPVTAIFGIYALQVAAFGGGLVTTIILYQVATRHGQTAVATMLLAGIALAALAMAVTGVLIFVADDQQLRDLTFWNLGSLSGANWSKVTASGTIIILALAATPFLARGLNGMTLGEATAAHMGVPLQAFKRVAIVTVAAATGAAVAVSGGIGFVGIVVPHLLRLVIGPDHRFLLPASAMLGAAFLLLADAVSRVVVAPAELPIGIVTAFVGGPFFLWILLRKRGSLGW